MQTFKPGDRVTLKSCNLPAKIVGVVKEGKTVVEYEVAGVDGTGRDFKCKETAERMALIPPPEEPKPEEPKPEEPKPEGELNV